MAVRQIVCSDISGKDIPEGKVVKVVVKDHPAVSGALVELDMSSDEAAKLQAAQLELVTLTIIEPGNKLREVVMDQSAFDSAFKGVDTSEVLRNARRTAPAPAPRARKRTAGASSSAGQKVDYTAPDKYGQLHRGRITNEEAALVRDNQAQASKNREAQGHPPIDFTDAKERARYQMG